MAELVCNEIKVAITFGRTKNDNETQLYLNQLTKITQKCQLKSIEANPTFITEILENSQEKQHDISQQDDTINQEDD